MDSRTGGDTRLVGHALELEVVVLVQVVAGDRLREAQLKVIAYAEYGVGGLRVAEQYRRTRILHTANHGRSFAYEARTVAAEAYGTQVVLLLHRVFLAVEAERSDLAVLDHRLVARSQVVQAVLGVERALVHPHLVALLCELVLELDVVEVLVVDIEARDINRQVVAHRVVRREGVHHPVLPRSSYLHRTGLRHEVYAEVQEHVCLRAVAYVEVQREVLVVIHLTALYLEHLLGHLSRGEEVTQSLHERCTVDIYLRAVGVAVTGQ